MVLERLEDRVALSGLSSSAMIAKPATVTHSIKEAAASLYAPPLSYNVGERDDLSNAWRALLYSAIRDTGVDGDFFQ
jgi:hypothetical protein